MTENHRHWEMILGVAALVVAGLNLLRDVFDWRLPWSPVFGWIIVAIVLLAFFVLILGRSKSLRTRLIKLIKSWRIWIINNWQLILGLLLLLAVACGTSVLTQSTWSIALTLWLAIAIVILIRSLDSPAQRLFEVVPLSAGKVANANLEGRYLNLPLGEVDFGGVRFLLKSGASVFDTSAARHIESDGSVKAELTLTEPVAKVKSVHLLINAGGGFRIDPDSKKSLEWLKIGRVELIFKDKTSQATELILGSNVREWAIGNFPGELIDGVDDPLSRVAWRGKNTSGKHAVIDRLEIPVLESNEGKKLEKIVFVREIPWRAYSSEGGKLHFFVAAVSLECKESRDVINRVFWVVTFTLAILASIIAGLMTNTPHRLPLAATSTPTLSPTPTSSPTPVPTPTLTFSSTKTQTSTSTPSSPDGPTVPISTVTQTPTPTATLTVTPTSQVEEWVTVRSFPAPRAGPTGIVRVKDILWVSVPDDERLYLYPLDLEGVPVAEPLNFPIDCCWNRSDCCQGGLAWDGESLWFSSFNTVHQLDPLSGQELAFFEVDLDLIIDIAWDGQALLMVDHEGNVVRYDRAGQRLRQFAIRNPHGGVAGMSWVKGELWVVGDFGDKFRFDSGFEMIGRFILDPGEIKTSPYDLALYWDRENLWVADHGRNRLLQYAPAE